MNKNIKLKEKKTAKIALIYNSDRGITLIALIITIIVMLILVGVTINVSLQGGLFSKAKEATKQAQKEIDREELQVAVWSTYNNQGTLELDKLKDNLPDGFSEEEGIYESEKGNLFIIENGIVKDVKWKQNKDGSITDGKVTLQIGDYVNYESILQVNPVTVDENTQIIKDLQEYSGLKEAKNEETAEYNTKNQIRQETDLKWRVLDTKNGNLRLISERPTESAVYLYGYNGYNNAVYLLDEICSTLYSTNKGTAQNLKIEDIKDKINKEQFDYTQYENQYVDTGKYGGTKECNNKYYPEIFAKEKTGWVDDNQGTEYDLSEQKEPIKQTEEKQAENKMKITHTYWNKIMEKTDWKNKIYHSIFIGEDYDAYWLSSRCIEATENSAYFRICDVNWGDVRASKLYKSQTECYGDNYRVRPVITLNSDIQIGDKVGDVWQIK